MSSLSFSTTQVNSDSLLDPGFNVYLVDASSNSITLTLPNIYADGITFTIKRIDYSTLNQVNLVTTNNQTIDTQTSLIIYKGVNITVQSFNGNWISIYQNNYITSDPTMIVNKNLNGDFLLQANMDVIGPDVKIG